MLANFSNFTSLNSLIQVIIKGTLPKRLCITVPLVMQRYRYDTGTVPTITIGTLPWYEVRTLTELLYSVKLFSLFKIYV